MAEKLTLEQAVIVMGFTGVACCPFGEFHKDVEDRMGRPVFTHEFADKEFAEKVKFLYKPDFIAMCV